MKKILDAIRHPKRLLRFVKSRVDSGMATAEYAIGTVAVVSFGSVILKILSDPNFREAIWRFILWLIDLIFGLFGQTGGL